MRRRTLLAAAGQVAAAAACAPLAPDRPPAASLSLSTDGQIGRIIAGLSLDERAGQLMNVSWHGAAITPALEAMIRIRKIGGVLIHSENFDDAASLRRLVADLQRIARDARALPLFVAIDQEGGAVTRIGKGATLLPGNMALAATPDPAAAVRSSIGILCRDMRAAGVNWDLAPVADVNNEPRNPIILNRSFGSDPVRVAGLVDVAVRAFAAERLPLLREALSRTWRDDSRFAFGPPRPRARPCPVWTRWSSFRSGRRSPPASPRSCPPTSACPLWTPRRTSR